MQLDLSVLAVILILVPLFYLLLAFPAFLLVRLDIPQVAKIFRSVLFGYFVVLLAAGLLAVALYAIDGRPAASICIALVTFADAVWRRWLMPRVDARLVEVGSGLAGAGQRLRRLHWAGMAANALQTAAILAFIPVLATVR